MSIKQMQVSYNGYQDRVFLVINTKKQESLKFALTRRICLDILESVGEFFTPNIFLESNINSTESSILDNEESEDSPVKIIYPLGSQSVLVTQYQVKSCDDSMIKIFFSCVNDKKVELNIDIHAFNDVLTLLSQVLDDANWGLSNITNKYGFSYHKTNSVQLLN